MENQIGLILGRKGLGKTTLARSLIPTFRRKVVLDSRGIDYGGGCVVYSAADYLEYLRKVHERREFHIIVRPRDAATPSVVFRSARAMQDVVFVVDEIDRYCSAGHADPNLRWIIDYGRGQRISLIGLARRAARVSRDLSANADWIVAFQTQEPRDLDYLADFGVDTEGLSDLEPFHWRSTGNVADLQTARN